MKTATEQTDRLFLSAALSDDGRGYPPGTAFVSYDVPEWPQITLRNLRQGQPTVVINSEGLEYLLLPHAHRGPRGWLDHLLHRYRAEVYWRHGDHTHGGFEVHVTRGTLERLDRQPQFAAS